MTIKPDDLRKCSMRATMFTVGEKGMAIQTRQCKEHPRLTSSWKREHRGDPGKTTWFVDGFEIPGDAYPDWQAACDLLNAEPKMKHIPLTDWTTPDVSR